MSGPDHPSFSIVIPTYQRRALVCQLVLALDGLEYEGRFEAIAVVDGSTDGTADALRGIECRLPLQVVEQSNRGAGAARDAGAELASGEILLFLDDDVEFEPGILSAYERAFAGGADVACGDIAIERGSAPAWLSAPIENWFAARSAKLRTAAALSPFDVLTGNLAVRRKAFDAVGGFDERFTAAGGYGCEDVDLGARLARTFELRACPDARVVQPLRTDPATELARAALEGAAERAFARKHPGPGYRNLRTRGLGTRRQRYLLTPLARVPLLSRLLSGVAVKVPALFPFARQLGFWQGVQRAGGIPASRSVTVLCYHAIADLSDDPVLAQYACPRDRFEEQLDDLQQRGFSFVEADELLGLLEGTGKVPRKALLLTFDDCYAELPLVARDVLRPRGIPAIAFAVAGLVGKSNEWDQPAGARKLELADAADLARTSASGVEIGCHSMTHRDLRGLPATDLARETGAAADALAALGLGRPRFFAYPYGESDGASRAAVAAAGFRAAFGLGDRRADSASDRFLVPRLEVFARDHGWRFRMRIARAGLSERLPRGTAAGRARRWITRQVDRVAGERGGR